MKLFNKTVIIFAILMLFVPLFVQATTVNMNLTTTDNEVTQNSVTQQNNTTNTAVNSNTTYSSNTVSPTTSSRCRR
jgi:cytoskeletal protein RodZ